MLPRLATFCSRITSIAVTSVLIGVRQQGQEASALDRDRQLTLIERLRTRDATRNDLARLGDVALQRGQIFVVNVLHALGGEATEFLTAGETAAAACTTTATTTTIIAATGATAAATTITATTAATAAIFVKSHCSLPRALRRLLRPGCPRHPRQQQHPHAGGAAAAHRRHRLRRHANGHGDDHHLPHRRPSPSGGGRSRQH